MTCPVCRRPHSGTTAMENGEWEFEPIGNLIRDAEGDELFEGMICAKWDQYVLKIYFHTRTDIEEGNKELGYNE